MATGIEVVGILLGSLPLIISALEHYARGVSTMKSMKEYENVFLDSQTRLLLSIFMFRRSCRDLVQGLPDTKIRELVDLRMGWDDKELREKLEWRLQGDFGIYMISVRQLNKRIDLLRRKLKLREDLTVPFMLGDIVDEKLRKEFFKKSWMSNIRGGFNAKKHKQLIADIRDDIDQLCNFTTGTVEIEDTPPGQSSSAISTYWLNFRSHADGLYNALSSIWPQSCATHSHQAKLRLDLPNSTSTDNKTTQLNLAFLKEDDAASVKNVPLEWQSVTVLSIQSPNTEATSPAPESANLKPTGSVPSSGVQVTACNKPTKQKQMKITRFSVPSVSIQEVKNANPICLSRIKINDLCITLRQTQKDNCCLGFLPSHERHYHIHDVVDHPRTLSSLMDIVHNQNNERMSTRKRRTIALALASGVLQLCDTSWLCDSWTMNDIYLESGKGSNALYVVKDFSISPMVSAITLDSGNDGLLVKNRTLFALGVALLELTYGASLSDLRSAEDLNDAFTHYRAATRLAKKIQDDELPRFASVVGKCIYPTPEGCDFSFANEAFRRRFFQDVVLPLRADYEELLPQKAQRD